jgi:hypothetical protein
MPKGKSVEVADLKLVRLQKLIESFMTAPSLRLMSLFGSSEAESDTVEWHSQVGNRGLTPFVAPGAPAPMTAPIGVTKHQAVAAYWKEKMYFDEEFLNNIKQEGTDRQYKSAQRTLAENMRMIRNRCDRRKEWMFAKMLAAGSFDYTGIGNIKIAVDYDVPSSQLVTLAADRQWDNGANRNVLEDVMDSKITLANAIGANIDYALFTAEILKLLVLDTGIQTLLQKSAFGQGDLFANPSRVLGSLLDIPNFVQYDEQYQLKAWLTSALAISGTTIYVDDTTDFEAAQTIYIHDSSAGTKESMTISSVDHDAGTITVSTGPVAAYKAGEDFITMTVKFLPTNKFLMFSSTVEGNKIAEFLAAPYGLGRNWGMFVDSKEQWDPDGIFIRVQNKGLPILYHRDAMYILTVTD